MSIVVDFPVYDADNHMYETTDAFTKHVPREYAGLIKYIQVNGRTKIAIRNVVSDYIPNPTFEVVARPGAEEEYYRHGNPEGKTRRELMGEPMRAPEAFFAPEPRLALMDELGIERAIMWPTLASVLEERLRDDPRGTHVIVHALNEWMAEHWTFDYEQRIYAAPVITLPIVDEAIRELEFVVERGAKVVLIRPAPVPGFEGPRSFALPEFDPFWERLIESGVAVGMHGSDDGMNKYVNVWEGRRDGEYLPFKNPSPFEETLFHTRRGIFDAMLSAVCHGLLTRFPTIRILPIENGSKWVRPLVEVLGESYVTHPHLFDEDPVEAFKRNVWVHPFYEDDVPGLTKVIGADRVVFGSDYPHPEGLVEPLSFIDELEGLPHDDVARIMGGNLAEALRL